MKYPMSGPVLNQYADLICRAELWIREKGYSIIFFTTIGSHVAI